MRRYRCRALLDGKPIVKTLEAPDRRTALETCEREGLIVLKIEPVRFGSFPPLKRVSRREVALLLLELATLLEAGVALVKALELLAAQTPNERLASELLEVKRALERGEPVARAFRWARSLPPYLFGMLSAVQTSEQLELVLKVAANHALRTEELRSKTLSALIYPAVVVGAALLALLFAVKFVLPKMEEILAYFGRELPAATRLLARAVDALTYLIVLTPLLLPAFKKIKAAREKEFAKLLLKLPLLGTVSLKVNLARFSAVMAMMLKAGVPLNRALETATLSLTNAYLKERLKPLAEAIERGRSLSKELERIEELPPLFKGLVAVGEESGKLDESFEKLSLIYERETYALLERAVALVEPAAVILIAALVGAVVLGVMLPLAQLGPGALGRM